MNQLSKAESLSPLYYAPELVEAYLFFIWSGK